MKYKILLIIMLTSLSKSAYSQTDTTLQKLLNINYTAYQGHTVDSLVKALPTNYTKMKVLPSHRGEYGDLLCIFYANDVSVAMKVKVFKYFNPHLDFSKPLNNQWSTTIFKKETLAYAIVYSGAVCKSGCQNDPQATAP